MDDLLYNVASIRAIEHAASAELGPGTLMRRAGQAAARYAIELMDGRRDLPVLLLAGPGNNGGDALEMAVNLCEAGIDAVVLYLPGSGESSAEKSEALQRAFDSDVIFLDELPNPSHEFSLVVDGLFGIGMVRELSGQYAEVAEGMHMFDCPVLALDIPSGLDANTGALVGSSSSAFAVLADYTLTFIGNKPGLYTGEGRNYSGIVRVESLGIEQRHFPAPDARLNGPALFAPGLAKAHRAHNTHKGSFGDVAVLGGAPGMAGAPLLAARAALLAGAGRVFVAALDPALAYDSGQPELMIRAADSFEFSGRVVVAGPGMGESAESAHLLASVIEGGMALVLDADALNQIARDPALQSGVAQRTAPTLLTPHPLEAARLLGITGPEVQEDRLAHARALARRFNAVVVLKGSGTVIVSADANEVVLNPTGNPALATAGTGDVLAGICGALLAQGWDAHMAALCAVWMHGAAADERVASGVGPIGMTAGELPAAVRALFNQLVRAAQVR
jgi:ADP-dependent NAD(P)H-hydrate dehydratase / NAD(P)H-hydrate epimerase